MPCCCPKVSCDRLKSDKEGPWLWGYLCPVSLEVQPCAEKPDSNVFWTPEVLLPAVTEEHCRYNPRPLFRLGVIWMEILRSVWIPCQAHRVQLLPIVYAAEKDDKKEAKPCVKCPKDPNESLAMETMKCTRKELWVLSDELKVIKRQMAICLAGLKERYFAFLCYLRQEENSAPRVGAIAVGGGTGYLIGKRKSFPRGIVYGTMGAVTIASLVYPKEAPEYANMFCLKAKTYICQVYNFLSGDDEAFKEKPEEQKRIEDKNLTPKEKKEAEKKAAKEKAAKEKCEKEKAAKEKAAMEKAAKEKAAKEKVAMQKAAKNAAARDKCRVKTNEETGDSKSTGKSCCSCPIHSPERKCS